MFNVNYYGINLHNIVEKIMQLNLYILYYYFMWMKYLDINKILLILRN